MLYKRMALTASGVRSPAVIGGFFRGVPLSFYRTLTVPARSLAIAKRPILADPNRNTSTRGREQECEIRTDSL